MLENSQMIKLGETEKTVIYKWILRLHSVLALL